MRFDEERIKRSSAKRQWNVMYLLSCSDREFKSALEVDESLSGIPIVVVKSGIPIFVNQQGHQLPRWQERLFL